jgi:hypothetical protein
MNFNPPPGQKFKMPLRVWVRQTIYAVGEKWKHWRCKKFGHRPTEYFRVKHQHWEIKHAKKEGLTLPNEMARCKRCSATLTR